MYLELSRPQPSPTELRRLSIRYAIDPRKPVDGDVRRFRRQRLESSWKIEEASSPTLARISVDLPYIVVAHPHAVPLLDLVMGEIPRHQELISLIEDIFGGRPSEADGLEAQPRPAFTYRVHESDERPTVELWIGDKEVALRNWKDIHKLLQKLCEQPEARLSLKQVKVLGVQNASQACAEIKKALEATRCGAGAWLLTVPIRWAERRSPRRKRGQAPHRTPANKRQIKTTSAPSRV
jgi:hypothetical protein